MPLRSPDSWPSQELSALRRSIERLNVSLELVEQQAGPGTGVPPAALTPREREVLTHAAAGLTVEQTAEAMVVSSATVRTYITRAVEKLGAANRVHAVALAVACGLVVPPAAS